MKAKMLSKVGVIARRVANDNYPFYTQDMAKLIPENILGRRLNDKNLFATSEEIDKIRFEKEKELSGMVGVSVSDAEFYDIINNKDRFKKLSPERKKKVKEIKFLFNVAATVMHQ